MNTIPNQKTKNENSTMKNKSNTSQIITSVILAISGFALSAQAVPIPVSGNISLSGTVTMDGTSFVSSTKFTAFQNVTVGAPSALSGSYVGTSGSAVTVTPFTWSPPTASTPINPLWSFVYNGDIYSFNLSVLHEDYASPTGLLLSGLGTAFITGPGVNYLATAGIWDFSAQTEGQSTFTFSSTTVVPASSVPDGGSTAAMMGASLIGLGILGRKQKQNPAKGC